jgi:hypothetical protein
MRTNTYGRFVVRIWNDGPPNVYADIYIKKDASLFGAFIDGVLTKEYDYLPTKLKL